MKEDTEVFDDAFETFIPTNSKDGRVFGYVVGLREVLNTGKCYAWVQRSIQTKQGFEDFGTRQRSRRFDSLQCAKKWAYAEAESRASKVKSI